MMRRVREWLADHPDFDADLAGAAMLSLTAWLIFAIADRLG